MPKAKSKQEILMEYAFGATLEEAIAARDIFVAAVRAKSGATAPRKPRKPKDPPATDAAKVATATGAKTSPV